MLAKNGLVGIAGGIARATPRCDSYGRTDGRTNGESTYVQRDTYVGKRARETREDSDHGGNGNHLPGVWRRRWRGVHQPDDRRGIPALRATPGAHPGIPRVIGRGERSGPSPAIWGRCGVSGTRRFSTRLQRNARWWWTFWATVEVALASLVDIPWLRLVDAAFAAWFGLWAGWHWREHVAIRRLERLDGQTGRDLIIATAQRYNRYGFAIGSAPMDDLQRKAGQR